MTTLDIDDRQLRVVDVTAAAIIFGMTDVRRVEAPLWWYPRLVSAPPEQRAKREILPFDDAGGWGEIDEYISATALIGYGAVPGVVQQAQAAE